VINRAIVDTGPLAAMLDRDEEHHEWAVEQIKSFRPPLLVCEAVLTEAIFLLKRAQIAPEVIFGLLESGAMTVRFSLIENVSSVRSLLHKYHDKDISLADACLIRMSELYENHAVLTLDSDFHIYRKHGRQSIELIFPSKR